jgi:integrase
MAKLTAIKVKRAGPGTYIDGDGLLLVVRKRAKGDDAEPSRQWVLRVQFRGKRHDIGLGSTKTLDLGEARAEAARLRRIAKLGENPLDARRRAAEAPSPTFREVAIAVHAEHSPTWRNEKHAAQWLASLESYAYPKLGSVPVDHIGAPLVRDALADFWLTRPETAKRVMQRIGTVLDYARSKGWRQSETPLQAIRAGLPKQPRKAGHFDAMPWEGVPGFFAGMGETLKAGDITSLLLEFTILTAARSGESRLASWGEMDLEARCWTIPANRMKAGKVHRVPLTVRTLEILDQMQKRRRGNDPAELIFPGRNLRKPIGAGTLSKALRTAELACTVHGFRSTFKDWSQEQTSFPPALAERALAHAVRGKTEAAYARSDLFERRRELMAAWEGYCLSARDGARNVTSLHSAKRSVSSDSAVSSPRG